MRKALLVVTATIAAVAPLATHVAVIYRFH